MTASVRGRAAGFAAALVAAAGAMGLGGGDGRLIASAQAQQQADAALFRTPDGALQFVLQRDGSVALLRIEGDPEVHVLRPDRRLGANGVVTYRNEDRSIAVRVTAWGELTVFLRNDRMGAPATFADAAEPLWPEPASPPAFRTGMAQAEQSLLRRVGVRVAIEPPPAAPEPQVAGAVLESVQRAVRVISARRDSGVRRIQVRLGPTPEVVAQEDRLVMIVAPQMGYLGIPSSADIDAAIDAR